MNSVEGTLVKIGLTKKETEVLLALLKLKKATVAAIARQGNIPRTTIYTALSKLLEKKMVLRVRVAKRELWEAVTPQRLLTIKQEQIIDLKSIIPDLEKLAIAPESIRGQSITQYKGVQGLQRVYDMALDISKGERIYAFEGGRSSEQKVTIFSDIYTKRWQLSVKRKGIILEVLISESILKIIDSASLELLESIHGRALVTHILPDDMMDFYSDILVFGHYVAIITPRQQCAVVIRDPLTTLAFKQLLKIASTAGRSIDLNAYVEKNIRKHKAHHA